MNKVDEIIKRNNKKKKKKKKKKRKKKKDETLFVGNSNDLRSSCGAFKLMSEYFYGQTNRLIDRRIHLI